MGIQDLHIGETFIHNGLSHMKVAPLLEERILLEVTVENDDIPHRIPSDNNAAILLDGDNIGRLVFICPLDEVEVTTQWTLT